MAKVKVFVNAIDAYAHGRAMTFAPRTYLSRLAKKKKKTGTVTVESLQAQSRFVKFYTFYKPTLGPKYVSYRPYNQFITPTTFIKP